MAEPKRTLTEFFVVAVAALLLGLLANSLHPRGLDLGRDYFAEASKPAGAPAEDLDAIVARLRAEGLEVLGHDEVVALFQDPLYEDEAYAFVDARNRAQYDAGHIPGAHHFDPHARDPGAVLGELLPILETSLKVVVYCYGQDCVDSEIAAKRLIAHGVPAELVAVYPGGIQAWRTAGLPLATTEAGE